MPQGITRVFHCGRRSGFFPRRVLSVVGTPLGVMVRTPFLRCESSTYCCGERNETPSRIWSGFPLRQAVGIFLRPVSCRDTTLGRTQRPLVFVTKALCSGLGCVPFPLLSALPKTVKGDSPRCTRPTGSFLMWQRRYLYRQFFMKSADCLASHDCNGDSCD